MGLADVIILAAVAAGVVLSVRRIVRTRGDSCSDCGSASTCSAHQTGGPCPAARDMLRNAESSLRRNWGPARPGGDDAPL